jgi:hypothetical protein
MKETSTSPRRRPRVQSVHAVLVVSLLVDTVFGPPVDCRRVPDRKPADPSTMDGVFRVPAVFGSRFLWSTPVLAEY